MNKNKLLLAAVAVILAACASTPGPTTAPSNAAQNPVAEKEYRTGSRIPVRDPVQSSPTKSLDPSAMNPSAPPRVL